MSRIHGMLMGTALAAGVAGCGSDGREVNAPPPRTPPPPARSGAMTSGALAPSMGQFRSDLLQGQQQIDNVLQSLNELTNPNQADLRGAYNKFSDQLAHMQQHEQTLRGEVEAMKNSRDQYFAEWEEEVSEIDNPSIRASAEARRRRLRDAHEEVTSNATAARDAYQPFLKDLQDIRKYLAGDLSRSTVADLGDVVRKVKANGAVVRDKLGALIQNLDTIQGSAAGVGG